MHIREIVVQRRRQSNARRFRRQAVDGIDVILSIRHAQLPPFDSFPRVRASAVGLTRHDSSSSGGGGGCSNDATGAKERCEAHVKLNYPLWREGETRELVVYGRLILFLVLMFVLIYIP